MAPRLSRLRRSTSSPSAPRPPTALRCEYHLALLHLLTNNLTLPTTLPNRCLRHDLVHEAGRQSLIPLKRQFASIWPTIHSSFIAFPPIYRGGNVNAKRRAERAKNSRPNEAGASKTRQSGGRVRADRIVRRALSLQPEVAISPAAGGRCRTDSVIRWMDNLIPALSFKMWEEHAHRNGVFRRISYIVFSPCP